MTMTTLRINGIETDVEEGTTVLEAARLLGIDIPTLCHDDGLSPYGACRLCIVEAVDGKRKKMVASCVCAAEAVEGFDVRTHSTRVLKARRMLIELLLAECPTSKTIQDLAARYDVRRVRFRQDNKQCILCGLCVRMCAEQMGASAIGYVDRGTNRRISTPFDVASDVCRLCGACMYICPAIELRCLGSSPIEGEVCGSCQSLQPTCVEVYPDHMCFMGDTGSCGTCIGEKEETVVEVVPAEGAEPSTARS